jgi:hypothetical protein
LRPTYIGNNSEKNKDILVDAPLNPAAKAESRIFYRGGFEETFVALNLIVDFNR